MAFDIDRFKKVEADNFRYDRQLSRIQKDGINTEKIDDSVQNSLEQIKKGVRAFVIFGEPQSGKTEMMICLTAKLLDDGKRMIIILLNDNNTLLKQNLDRFKLSGIDPDPKDFNDILDPHIKIGTNKWIIFCKKNATNLRKIIDKIGSFEGKVIIDDEADYATPNSRINQGEQATINDLVGQLYDDKGTYIGVTATPARLDLNNTYDNANDSWVYFKPHSAYTGQEVFFPINLAGELKYKLNLLDGSQDEKDQIRKALFSFLITVAHRNIQVESTDNNYSMLIHTSRKKVDHTADFQNVLDIMNVLSDKDNKNYELYLKEIWNIANVKYGEDAANKILEYVLTNISRRSITVMNSDKKSFITGWDSATNPKVPFSIIIGGDIVSRGVTFKNLLSMFFTRDVQGRMHQDTYIQRARMFGTRNNYIKDFELWIPEDLFTDWHKCFVFHRLALQSIISGNRGPPVWLEDSRIAAVSSSSIDRTTVSMASGEMGFDVFDYSDEVDKIITDSYDAKVSISESLKNLHKILSDKELPGYLIEYVNNFSPDNEKSLAIHKSRDVSSWRDADQDKIERAKGFMGTTEMETTKFPNAIHHFKIMKNSTGKARLFYRYVGNIRFLKNLKRD